MLTFIIVGIVTTIIVVWGLVTILIGRSVPSTVILAISSLGLLLVILGATGILGRIRRRKDNEGEKV